MRNPMRNLSYQHIDKFLRAVMLGVLLFLSGCDVKNTPVDVTLWPLVGAWQGERVFNRGGFEHHQKMFFVVNSDGELDFRRLNCWRPENDVKARWVQKHMELRNMPIIRITAKKIVAQWMPFSTKLQFTVNSWADSTSTRPLSIDDMVLKKAEDLNFEAPWQC